MKRTFSQIFVAGLAAAICMFAQGGPAASGLGPVDMAQQSTVDGDIVSLQIGYGTRTPSFTVDGKVIRLAPVWYFLDNDFELSPGEAVRVVVAPAIDKSLHAVAIVKTATGTKLTLRSETGTPLWIGGAGLGARPGSGQQQQNATPARGGAPCIDPLSARTMTGVVEELTAGYGVQYPSLILVAADVRIAIKLGPERVIQQSGIDFSEGVTLTIQYATSTCTEDRVAMTITDAEGKKLVLRTETGAPAW